MDILQEVLDKEIKSFAGTNNEKIEFIKFINLDKIDKNKSDRKAEKKVAKIVSELDIIIKRGMVNIDNNEDEKDEILNSLDEEVNEALGEYNGKLGRNTIGHLLMLIAGEGQTKKVKEIARIKLRLMNYMYRKNPEVFLEVFEKPQNLDIYRYAA